jgi:hypothetical protein
LLIELPVLNFRRAQIRRQIFVRIYDSREIETSAARQCRHDFFDAGNGRLRPVNRPGHDRNRRRDVGTGGNTAHKKSENHEAALKNHAMSFNFAAAKAAAESGF